MRAIGWLVLGVATVAGLTVAVSRAAEPPGEAPSETKAQVAAAPEYKEDKPIVVLGASGSLQPLQAVQ